MILRNELQGFVYTKELHGRKTNPASWAFYPISKIRLTNVVYVKMKLFEF